MSPRLVLPLLTTLLFSCAGQAPEPMEQIASQTIERVVEEVAVSGTAPTTLADLSITGMSCEMMCGGSIKKALAQLPGVNSTEIRFIEGDENDHAVVDYDATKVTDEQLISAVQGLYEGQYKVVAVKITKQVSAANATHTEAAKAEDKGVSVLDPAAVVVPGILALLSHVLRL